MAIVDQPGYGSLRPVGKRRGGVTVVLLSIVTLGIYWLVYVFKTHSEIRQHSGLGLGGGVALLLAIFLGFLTPFLLGHDVQRARSAAGLPPRVSWLTGFWTLIPLLGLFIFVVKIQNALNDYWASQR
jgi:hypothetical protein